MAFHEGRKMQVKQKTTVSVRGTVHCHYPDREQLLAWVERMNEKVQSIIFDDEGKMLLTIPWETLPQTNHIEVIIFPGPITRSHAGRVTSLAPDSREVWLGDSSVRGTMVSEIAHDWVLCHELTHCYTKATLAQQQRFLGRDFFERPPEVLADRIADQATGYSRQQLYTELGR